MCAPSYKHMHVKPMKCCVLDYLHSSMIACHCLSELQFMICGMYVYTVDGDIYHGTDNQIHRSTGPHATHMQRLLAGTDLVTFSLSFSLSLSLSLSLLLPLSPSPPLPIPSHPLPYPLTSPLKTNSLVRYSQVSVHTHTAINVHTIHLPTYLPISLYSSDDLGAAQHTGCHVDRGGGRRQSSLLSLLAGGELQSRVRQVRSD